MTSQTEAVRSGSRRRFQLLALLVVAGASLLALAGWRWASSHRMAQIRSSIEHCDWDQARREISDYPSWAGSMGEVAMLGVRVERKDGDDESFRRSVTLARNINADQQQIQKEQLLYQIQSGQSESLSQPIQEVLTQFVDDEAVVYDAFALGHLANGNPARSMEVLGLWMERFPDDARSHLVQGSVFAAYDKQEYAIDAYSKSVELNPDLFDGQFSLAVLLSEESRYDEALSSYLHAQTLDPNRIDVQLGIGEMLWALQREDQAVEYLTRVLRDYPFVFRAGYLVGKHFTNLGDGDSAITALTPVLKHFPENAALNYQWAMANQLVGNDAAADEALSRFIYANQQLDSLKPILKEARSAKRYKELMTIADTFHRFQWDHGVEWLRLAGEAAPFEPGPSRGIAAYMNESGAFEAAAKQRARVAQNR